MSPRTLLLLLIAVVIAGGTALLARSYLASQRAQQVARIVVAQPKPQRAILVAKSDIARGQLLKPDDMSWQVWPDNAIAPAYIVQGGGETAQSFAGWVAVDAIAGGSPVTKTTIISPGSGGFLAAVLKPGMRAIQVPTPGELPVGTQAGDRVDMIVYFPVEWNKANAVETVMHEIRILALPGQAPASKQVQVPGASPVSAIFEVTPKEAEVITLAMRMGSQVTFTLDSLRQGAAEAAARRGVVAATYDAKNDPPASTMVSDTKPAQPAGAENAAPSKDPTYMTDDEVNRLLHSPSKQITVPITVIKGAVVSPPVNVSLDCTQDGCALANGMPEKLVSPQELQ
jgi:pilus assembly protein CpaB